MAERSASPKGAESFGVFSGFDGGNVLTVTAGILSLGHDALTHIGEGAIVGVTPADFYFAPPSSGVSTEVSISCAGAPISRSFC